MARARSAMPLSPVQRNANPISRLGFFTLKRGVGVERKRRRTRGEERKEEEEVEKERSASSSSEENCRLSVQIVQIVLQQ